MQYKSKVPVAAWGEPARPGLALHLLPCAVGQSLLSPRPDFSAPAAKMMKQEVGYVALPLGLSPFSCSSAVACGCGSR